MVRSCRRGRFFSRRRERRKGICARTPFIASRILAFFAPMKTHDPAYREIFSYPRMVEDLLRGFVHAPWVKEVDFSTLERISSTYIADDLRERMSDVIWKVNVRETPLYIYLLLEFQSQVDPWMAARLNVYAGLLLRCET